MNNISAITVVRNNPPHLFETLASIQNFVKEIVIVDIGIDPSVSSKLRENHKVKVVVMKKNVPYVELIREEIKDRASEDYILFIDPDEILGDDLKKLLSSVYSKFDYIKIPRKNIIFGKWIEHSRWWPDYQTRLFKKMAVTWPKRLHASPKVSGNGYTIGPKESYAILHYNYESVDEFMEKAMRYAKSEASELSSFSLKDAVKGSLSEFMSRYFAEKGYKDGIHGFILAFLQMFYYFLVYVYFWELKNKPSATHQELIETPRFFFKQGTRESGYWMIKEKLMKGKDVILHKIIEKLLS